MQLRLITVGQKMPGWVEQGYKEYARRFPRDFALELVEVPAVKRGKNADIVRLTDKEGEAMLSHISSGDWVIALDVKGKQYSTSQLASQIEHWQLNHPNVVLLVGGPEGLAPACLQRANQKISLSNLTFPHPLVRVLIAEALYRAWSVTVNHPYHRE
ncbi:23S rRNA (pseudouridine(1915)-N(3))-methyltransferase RlmH [Kangiella sediminilitoris]|uniref:Ribosomal RNA large subunit methyltransferase H n=1 Tax=Kangiella sediminilitoris TaxID=1144748 RepID=A0A1B3BD67_9GAMM|nr:23S rRNA (pseudouridine(1915)-N(3))-methyltransferase RlmH [Kangiella sediminilitoris]AOE50784.1 Ribosomal RNA large subunit methyltransferase H [Kangiella sediminilitoris]